MVHRDPNIGRLLGPYQLVRRVGEGGMGSVYAAKRADHQYEKLVAIKILKPNFLSSEPSETSVRRFRTERQALAGLEHPNIARLLDGGSTEDGLPYLVMEYVEGEPLDRYLNVRQLSIAERIQTFRTVCSAVQYAHQNLIVHRDLKPNNILVTADGVPKLLDFGIAKLLDPKYAAELTDLTQNDSGPMTPQYAAPEQVRGDPVTTATDVYALGVLLYVLLTGRHPFLDKAGNALALHAAILMDEPERPSAAVLRVTSGFVRGESPERLSRRLRGDLDTIILTALRKDPLRRYASVDRMSDDLGSYLRGLPIAARKDNFTYRAAKFVRRHAAAVAAASVAVVALIASSAVAIRSAQVAQRERVRAEGRFNEVRQLAHFVLFDLDSAIRSGATPARKTVVEEALKYLARLEKDTSGDLSLDHELIAAYMQVGDLQGNLYSANVGDAEGARRSYENAARIADAVAAAHPNDPRARHDAAAASVRIANLLSLGANRDEALRRYNNAKDLFQKLASEHPGARKDLMDVWAKIGFTRLQASDLRGALDAYRHCLQIARELAQARPQTAEARRAVAYGTERVGYALAKTGSFQQGLEMLRQALAQYRELAASAPDQGAAQHDIADTQAIVGDVLSAAHRNTEAETSYREALATSELLLRSDPGNGQYRRDWIMMLGRLADALANGGKTAEARALTLQALAALQPLMNRPDTSVPDIVQYCVLLESLDSSRAAEALPYAQRLVASTKERDPTMLEILAKALYASGDFNEAIRRLEQALAIVKSQGSPDMVAKLEQDLNGFRSRAPHGKT